MQKSLSSLMIALAFASAAAPQAHAASNEDVVKRHFASLVAGPTPKTSELQMFLTMMPKGGDLHHHYSGAIYAEQYLEWVDKQGFCVNKTDFRINTAAGAKSAACVSGKDLVADNAAYRALLQKWSTADFYNHSSGKQLPPDQTFFDTFGYFNDVASTNGSEGLQTLKKRAIAENLSYIETIYEIAPITPDGDFDKLAAEGLDNAKLNAALNALVPKLEASQAFQQGIQNYLAHLQKASAGVDDEQFTMRYQPFVLRFLPPSMVFSQMLASFKLAKASPQIVGVNIVGQESLNVSMRDYSLHMQMFKFLKAKYPDVKMALHAGELALGVVPPEGLKFHIQEAVNVAGANRIGHGIDIAHESNALAIMKTMRERRIPVEVNLTSNEFILGVKGAAHPLDLYRKYGVPFVISTDDAGVTRHNLSNEYVLFATRYKTDYAEVKKLSYDSIRYSFLADADKKRLLQQLDTRFSKFEADIAGALLPAK